ncbi:MAG: transposase [Dehalococcoidia bacterium]
MEYLFKVRWPEGFRCPRCNQTVIISLTVLIAVPIYTGKDGIEKRMS